MYLIVLSIIIAILSVLSIILGRVFNMRKVFLSGILVLLVLSIFVFLGTMYSIQAEREDIKNEVGEYKNVKIQVPDRIIYKKGETEYYVITNTNEYFSGTFADICNSINAVKEGRVLTEGEINEIKDNGSFIEFDYNRESKNYIFPLDEKDIGMIKMFTDNGQIQLNTLRDKGEIRRKLNIAVRSLDRYEFDKTQSYTSETTLKKLPEELGFTEKQYGIYQEVVLTENRYNEILEKIGLKGFPKMISTNFIKEKAIITISDREIEAIIQNIGNIKYKLKKKVDGYTVNVLIVSQVVNTNCIYVDVEYDASEFEQEVIDETEYPLDIKGIITNISENKIEVGYDSEITSNIIHLNEGAKIKEYPSNNELQFTSLQVGDSVNAIGYEIENGNSVKEIEVDEIKICKRDTAKSEAQKYIKDTYRIDGYGIVDKYIKADGTGIIIIGISFDNFIYPIRLKVDKNTETYLGMNQHIQDNYGYILYEICDITLDTKITDIDNILGTVKMIEYITD